MILMQRPDANAVMGYRAWQALGHRVRKGETSIKILAPSDRTGALAAWARKAFGSRAIPRPSGRVSNHLRDSGSAANRVGGEDRSSARRVSFELVDRGGQVRGGARDIPIYSLVSLAGCEPLEK